MNKSVIIPEDEYEELTLAISKVFEKFLSSEEFEKFLSSNISTYELQKIISDKEKSLRKFLDICISKAAQKAYYYCVLNNK